MKTSKETTPVTDFAATIGLDWADQKHDLWIQPVGGQPEHKVIDQTPESLHGWVAQMRQRFGGQKIAIALETTRGPVISALGAYDFIVFFPVNPSMLCNYRQSFRNSGAKDDRTDAKLLESYLRCHHAELRPIEPDTELTRKLAGLVEIRRGMVGHRTDLVNELHSILKTYFHLMEVLFEDLTLPVASDFLLKWPDLDSAQKAGDKALRKFFYGHNCRGDKKLDRRLEAIKKALPLTKDPAIIEPAAIKARFLASLLAPAHRSIAEIDEKIKEATDAHPDAPIFRSFPCAGPAMVPRLLVAFGTNRDRFDSATEVQQYYGIAPVRKQSGKSSVVHMRHRCPKFGRQTFHENAGHAVRPEGWAKAFYEQLRANEKGHHAAVRTVAFKLIRIYFRCWKDRQPYDPGKYEAALQKHGSPLTKSLQPKTQKLQ